MVHLWLQRSGLRHRDGRRIGPHAGTRRRLLRAAPIAGPTMVGTGGSGVLALAQDDGGDVSIADSSPESEGAEDEQPVDNQQGDCI